MGAEMNIPTNRWQRFRMFDEEIPTTPREAAIFVNNAYFHMLANENSCHESRNILLEAHERINADFVAESLAGLMAKEVA
jgi:hypothetical protein